MDNSPENKNILNRRKLLQALSLGGIGSALLAYQNCSNVGFSAVESSSKGLSIDPDDPNDPGLPTEPGTPNPNPACIRPLNIYDLPAHVPVTNAALTTFNGMTAAAASGEHSANAKFYRAPYYDNSTNTQRVQHLLTIDVGTNPAAKMFHPVANSNFANLNILSDTYVYRKDTGALLYWKRFGSHDQIPAAMITLDDALVTGGVKLLVVTHCLQHGYFSQTVDLALPPQEYSTAVGTFAPGTPFGTGSSLYRPYVSLDATGGQDDIGAGHSPHFHNVTNTQVQVTLGPVNARHGRGGPDHYIAGGVLFDQHGNILALQAEQTYAAALNHNMVFNNLDLAGRGVKILRAVLFDTYNGILQGFFKLP